MKRRFIKKIAPLLVVFMVAFAFPLQPLAAAEGSSTKAELTLVVGSTDLDTSNFAADVERAVYEIYGISSDRIKINKAGTNVVDSKDDFSWTIYDHYYAPEYPTDGSQPADWADTHGSQPYFYYTESSPEDSTKYFSDVSTEDDSMSYCNNRSKHIYAKDKDLIFLGYSAPAYKDFMVYPDQNSGEKTIEFAIDQSGVSTHTLEGAGFLFNASIVDNKLNGYLVFYNYQNNSIDLYKLADVDATAFHQEAYNEISDLGISGISLIASKAIQSGAQVKNIKVQTTANSLKFFEDGVAIYDTTGDDSAIVIEDTGAGGFGPLVSYESHGCSELTYFTFKNLAMVSERSVTFLDVANEQSWSEANRIIVNLDDDGVPEFNDPATLNQVASQLNANTVHYLGWGRNLQVGEAVYNADQAGQLLSLLNGRGLFINMDDPASDTYEKGIAAIAQYINALLSVVPETEQPPTHHHSSGGGGGGSTPPVQPQQQPAPPPVPDFIDMDEHWAHDDVYKLAKVQLIGGYPDGTFRPDAPVTRAEFTSMLAQVFKYAGLKRTTTEMVNFSDVPSEAWYYEAVSLLAPEKIILGYGDGTFGPDRQITREEAAAMLDRMLAVLNVQLQNGELNFADNDQISEWAKDALGRIADLGIIKGMPDGTFQPGNNTTRAEAAVMILRMLEQAKII